jgi:NAD(P)-dependent dehydrogenase (short-subunit alcohol dehydrogenase family)
MKLTDTVSIVTGGGGGGTGRAICSALARAGSTVVVADVDGDGGATTVRSIEQAGGRAAFVHADVTALPDVRRMVETAEVRFGGLDILVNNAGGTPRPHFPAAPTEHWSRTLDLNLRGPMMAIQQAIEPMRRRGGGAVVNISSVAGVGFEAHDSPEYAAAKAGLIRLAATLAPLAERHAIRVNCVVPNWIGTAEVLQEIERMDPAERAEVPPVLTPPEEIADAVIHFLRHDSLAGRVMVCWSGEPWRLFPVDPRGYPSEALEPVESEG